jgi:hypothetical protein
MTNGDISPIRPRAKTGSYVRGVAAIHRKYQTALKHSRSRQSVLNAYWRHKKESERLLARHLKDELAEIKRIKGKMEYR